MCGIYFLAINWVSRYRVLAKAIYHGAAPPPPPSRFGRPFQNQKRHFEVPATTILAAHTVLAQHKSSRKTVVVGTWHAFIRSRAILWYSAHKNGENKANNVAKVAEKIKGKMMDEYGGVQHPPHLPFILSLGITLRCLL